MKTNKHALRIAVLSTAFALSMSTVMFLTAPHKELDATQYIGNYDPYTYSGNYYDGINFDAAGGMNGTLRTVLTTKIKPQGFYTYGGGGADHLSGVLQDADEDPTNPNNMVTFYTRDSITKTAATVNSKVIWNREHVWCQSLSNGNWGETQGGTDILHLRPTYASPNSTRNNHKYGDNTNGTAKSYEGKLYGWLEGDFFEPLDCVKGDAARIIMYVWTTYTGWPGYNSLNITNVIRDYDTLLRWHTLDKPDALEGNRNNYAETSKQKNRNPFVDHPELAWKIFGDMASTSVKNSCMATYPANGSGEQINPTGIELNRNTATVEVGRTTQLRATLSPAGATGTIAWTSTNPSIASVNSNGLVTGNAVGSTTITATVGSYSDSCTVTVSENTNNYGTLENPLNISDALEVLYDAGDSLTTDKIYVRGVVSSNTAFNTQYSNYDSIWLQSDDGEDEQALQLFRAKLDNSITTDYSGENSLAGCEVVVHGYGQKYHDIYELAPKNNANNPLILSVTPPVQTTILLNQSTAEIEVGNTVTLTATLTPDNPYAQLVWETSDETVATVNGGVVTGVGTGTATIAVKLNESITASCEVTVTDNSGQQNYVKVASYDFSSDLNSTTAYTDSELLARFNSSAQSGTGLSNIVDSISNSSKVYPGQSNYTDFGLKLGSGSANGYFTANLSTEVSRVIVNTVGWGTTDYLTIGDADSQTPGVAYTSTNPIKTLTFDITSSDSVEFVFAKRGYIQTIDFYTAGEPVNVPTPEDHLGSTTSFMNVNGTETTTPHVESFTFSNMGLGNAEDITDLAIGSATINSDKGTNSNGNTPKYYTSGSAVRIYWGNTFTFTSDTNITSIEFDFAQGSGANVSASSGTIENDTWAGNASSITFTCTLTTGQIRISSVTITYADESIAVSSVYLKFGASIPVSDWTAINDNEDWEITDYGIMLTKEATLESYEATTIAEAFDDGEALLNVNKGSGAAPYQSGDNYIFSARINIKNDSYYGDVIYAAPYIVVNDTHYCFLTEIHGSVNTIATYCLTHGGSNLSNDALTLLQ